MALPKLAILIAQHPAINHAVILREVRELRQEFAIFTASIRAPDRPTNHLSDEERAEASQTYYVKNQRLAGAIAAHGFVFFTRPGAYLGGLWFALNLAGLHPKKIAYHLAYYTQALIVGRWMSSHQIKHLHVHYSSTVGLMVSHVFPVGLSISFHGPDEFDDPVGFRLREKIAACTFVRAISQYARSQLMKSSAVENWKKIHVVYMGVDPNTFSPRPFRPHPDPLELICVGRLAPVKAQHILIAAIDRLVQNGRKVRLHVVGGGPDRASLQAEVTARALEDSVIFHGFTPQDKLDALYRSADVFVLASFAEGVPGVLMEAMAMEIPCVSTWITGVPELIRNRVDGLLVAPSDDQAFANAIATLMDDPSLRERIGKAGRARVLELFNLPVNAHGLARLLKAEIQQP